MGNGFPPLAPLPTETGTRFRVFSRAPHLHLQLYAHAGERRPSRTIPLDAAVHRHDAMWEIVVPDVSAGQLYTWAREPHTPLLDPYSLAVSGPERFGQAAAAPAKSVVVAPLPDVDWKRPRTPWHKTVIYELHVRGFTRHESAAVADAGTYRALGEKAGYLRDLGVTAVELLPVHEFDETELTGRLPGLLNFWGYSPVAWLAPHRRYAAAADAPDGPLLEFREMVLALHRAGIEVIVDVVFNHTAELDAAGPTRHLRGLDDEMYYLRDESGGYADLSGCGNAVRAQHPTVRTLIRDALRWWVHGLGVDGFRFDLATILARDESGELMDEPPLLREIEHDPALRDARLIAEAWDAAGGYRVADWPGGERWAVWNDRFRDDVRRAWLEGNGGALAARLAGSPDLFPNRPLRSVNYVTAHDGFTLRDTVSYARRHNRANGEKGRDGHAHEVSANHGAEGPSDDPDVAARRDRARRNLVASLLLARGVPMMLAGDDSGRTQRGNNNAYCHDSDLTWIDWTDLETDAAFWRFVRGLLHLRRDHAGDEFAWILEGETTLSYALGSLLVLVNTGDDDVSFDLPPQASWRVVVDTAAAPPGDLVEPKHAAVCDGSDLAVPAQSLTVLLRA
jgi:glycogen operon protein